MSPTTRTKPAPKRPKMTAEDATTFSTFSTSSLVQTFTALEERRAAGLHTACACEPYADVFTYGRWQALGRHVAKGERAIKIHSFIAVEPKDDADPNAKPFLRPKTMSLFCRCQTEPNEPKGS